MSGASIKDRNRPYGDLIGNLAEDRQTRAYAPFFYGSLVLVALAAVAFYWPTLSVGFLLDDYLHVGYLHQALQGHPGELLKRLYGVWSYTTDSLSSYRPGVTVSFWLDYTFFHGSAWGMHLSNILLTALACVAVSLVSLELSAALALPHRYVTALGSGLLFAAYPLHPEATAWIVARADVLGALLYLLSLWTFLRFRRTEKRLNLTISLAAFFAAMTMKETTVTLPITVTLAALLVYPGTPVKQIGSYWAVLAGFAVLRTAVIGQLVGGYGDVGINAKQIIRNYLDRDTFAKLWFGATEEMPVASHLKLCNSFALGLAGILGLSAAVTNRKTIRLFAFLILWCGASLTPAFQIWHIFPNLVGSRIFWIGSAPLCMLISFAALACADALPKNLLRLPLGVIAVTMLCSVWYQLLQVNLVPWTIAGQHVQQLQKQVQELAQAVPPGQRVLLCDLPQDYKGAPEVGRPEFLDSLCKPPFANADLTDRVITAQRPIAGGHEFIYPRLLKQLQATTSSAYKWDDGTGMYVPLIAGGEATPFTFRFNATTAASVASEPAIAFATNKSWALFKDVTGIASDEGVEIHVGKQGLTCWLPLSKPINPTELTAVMLSTEALKDTYAPALVWQANPSTPVQTALAAFDNNGLITYLPGRNKSWTLASHIERVGFSFRPGDYFVRLRQADLLKYAAIEPSVRVSTDSTDLARQTWVTTVNATNSKLAWDATDNPSCRQVCLFITKPWHALPDTATASEPATRITEWTQRINAAKGDLNIPEAILKKPGIRQVAVLPLDENGKICGVLSEPRSILVP